MSQESFNFFFNSQIVKNAVENYQLYYYHEACTEAIKIAEEEERPVCLIPQNFSRRKFLVYLPDKWSAIERFRTVDFSITRQSDTKTVEELNEMGFNLYAGPNEKEYLKNKHLYINQNTIPNSCLYAPLQSGFYEYVYNCDEVEIALYLYHHIPQSFMLNKEMMQEKYYLTTNPGDIVTSVSNSFLLSSGNLQELIAKLIKDANNSEYELVDINKFFFKFGFRIADRHRKYLSNKDNKLINDPNTFLMVQYNNTKQKLEFYSRQFYEDIVINGNMTNKTLKVKYNIYDVPEILDDFLGFVFAGKYSLEYNFTEWEIFKIDDVLEFWNDKIK